MSEGELREAYAWAGTLRGRERDHWLALMASSERNGAVGERKAVVAWLRAFTGSDRLNQAAQAFEDREHLK